MKNILVLLLLIALSLEAKAQFIHQNCMIEEVVSDDGGFIKWGNKKYVGVIFTYGKLLKESNPKTPKYWFLKDTDLLMIFHVGEKFVVVKYGEGPNSETELKERMWRWKQDKVYEGKDLNGKRWMVYVFPNK